MASPADLCPILCDPTERPEALINLTGAIRDTLAQKHGTDFLWSTPFGWAGIQRKTISDFLTSIDNGMLAEEVLKMGDVTWKFLIIEGVMRWGTSGELQGQYRGGISIKYFDSICYSLDFFKGVRVRLSDGISETAGMIKRIHEWTSKDDHTGFCAKIGANREKVDMATGLKVKVDWREWILMHLPGVGSKTARDILKYEAEPLEWWDRGRQLEKIPGIGKLTAEKMRKALKPPC